MVRICGRGNTLRNSQGEERGFTFDVVFKSLQSLLEIRKEDVYTPSILLKWWRQEQRDSLLSGDYCKVEEMRN